MALPRAERLQANCRSACGTTSSSVAGRGRMEHSKTKFHPVEHTVHRKTFYSAVVVLVLVGPSVGFLAAGLLYGTVSGHLEAVGQNLQAISSWVRWRCPDSCVHSWVARQQEPVHQPLLVASGFFTTCVVGTHSL